MIGPILKAVRAVLVADATLSASMGTRWYNSLAPQGTALPYGIFTLVAGGDTNDTPTDNLDVLIDCKVIAESASTVLTLTDAVRAALHHADLTLDGGWLDYDCQHTDVIPLIAETVEQRQYYSAGGSFRVRASKG